MKELFAYLHPEGWAAPRGYSDGIVASGRMVFVSGQVGWNPATGRFETDDFAEQTAQALANVVSVLRAAGADPAQLVRLTWYVTDREEYLDARAAIGTAYRRIIGTHYPTMTLVVVAGLIEEQARVELEATAVVPA